MVIFKSIDEHTPCGVIMIKTCGVLALLALLASVSSASDYLEGGYVGSYQGDMGQYFTDPIFTSSGNRYVSPDPALNMMLDSMDRPVATLGSGVAKPAARQTIGKTASKAAAMIADLAGRWHLELSEGKSMDLYLHQSGSRIFGTGSMTSGLIAQEVTASGSVIGSSLILDVVADRGTALYAASLDISRLHLPSSYTVFRAGSQPNPGTLRASRMP